MSNSGQWRKPIEADKGRKCFARNQWEKRPFYVVWNTEYNCWAIAGRTHILVAVQEIFGQRPTTQEAGQ